MILITGATGNNGRELVRQLWRDHLKDLFRLMQVPQAVGAERAQADSRR